MKHFRTWFTPGSVVAATIVALFWLHRLHLPLMVGEAGQIVLICLTFVGLWALSRGQPHDG